MTAQGGAFRFDDGKEPDALRTIGEVADALGIRQHVLRYWEQQFPQLRPLKRSGGRRMYRAADVQLVATIDRMVNREGLTLKGAALALSRMGGAAALAETAAVPVPQGKPVQDRPAQDILPHLRTIRHRLATALAS